MAGACSFCGSNAGLTREHLFGEWVSQLGLDTQPAEHWRGPLNRIGRRMGVREPFQQTVRAVCAKCNNGWMSDLEAVAQRTLSGVIRGEPGTLAVEDLGAIAAWAQKTSLVAMLISSRADRAQGYGLPESEYEALYQRRAKLEPLPASRFWLGKYDGGDGFSGVRVTPMCVRIAGLAEPELPQAYAMTIALGQMLVHGVRFTSPTLEIDLASKLDLPQLWPATVPVPWPSGEPCPGGEPFLQLADGRFVKSIVDDVELRAWTEASDLPPSTLVDGAVQLPLICGEHAVPYPIELVEEAMRGRFYAFVAECECGVAYLIHTESTGAHCKRAGAREDVAELYERLSGEERSILIRGRTFTCKALPSGR